jgi:hypothetical protein
MIKRHIEQLVQPELTLTLSLLHPQASLRQQQCIGRLQAAPARRIAALNVNAVAAAEAPAAASQVRQPSVLILKIYFFTFAFLILFIVIEDVDDLH